MILQCDCEIRARYFVREIRAHWNRAFISRTKKIVPLFRGQPVL